MPPPEPPGQKHPDVLVDTCIIQYAADDRMGDEVTEYLKEILERGQRLALCEMTIYELIAGASITKEAQLLKWLTVFKRYQVDLNVFIAAARLKTLYDMQKLPQTQISDGDKMIAATSVLTGSFILTANGNDFPRPCFKEIEQKHIFYIHKNIQRMIPIQLLSPDNDTLNYFFSNRPK